MMQTTQTLPPKPNYWPFPTTLPNLSEKAIKQAELAQANEKLAKTPEAPFLRNTEMKIDEQTTRQFLDAINDYVSNGDIVIDAITPEEAGRMPRKKMDAFLKELMKKASELK